MKVSVKEFNVSMEIGNKGIQFDVYDNQNNFLGDLRIGRGTIEWCKGKAHSGNKVGWPELIKFLESQ